MITYSFELMLPHHMGIILCISWIQVAITSICFIDFDEGFIKENISSETCLILGALQIWYQRQVDIFFMGYRVWS